MCHIYIYMSIYIYVHMLPPKDSPNSMLLEALLSTFPTKGSCDIVNFVHPYSQQLHGVFPNRDSSLRICKAPNAAI